jgi:hypothetical protein
MAGIKDMLNIDASTDAGARIDVCILAASVSALISVADAKCQH